MSIIIIIIQNLLLIIWALIWWKWDIVVLTAPHGPISCLAELLDTFLLSNHVFRVGWSSQQCKPHVFLARFFFCGGGGRALAGGSSILRGKMNGKLAAPRHGRTPPPEKKISKNHGNNNKMCDILWSLFLSSRKKSDYFPLQPRFGYVDLNGENKGGCIKIMSTCL